MLRAVRLRPTSTWRSGLNITPLVDIVFQLIVFFLLVSQVVTAEREPMQLPHPTDSQARQKAQVNRLVINLFADDAGKVGKIKVGAHVVDDLAELVDLLLKFGPQVQAKGTSVILRADKRVQFDQIQPVLKALSNASVGSLEIATEQAVGVQEVDGR